MLHSIFLIAQLIISIDSNNTYKITTTTYIIINSIELLLLLTSYPLLNNKIAIVME